MTDTIWLCKWCYRTFTGTIPPGEMCPFCNGSSPHESGPDGHGQYWIDDGGLAHWTTTSDGSHGRLHL